VPHFGVEEPEPELPPLEPEPPLEPPEPPLEPLEPPDEPEPLDPPLSLFAGAAGAVGVDELLLDDAPSPPAFLGDEE